MLEPFIGQLLCVPYRTCPPNWLFCQGQQLSIADYTSLYSLIGVTYGGNGETTFALPDLRGRVPLGAGQGPGLPPYAAGNTTGVVIVWLRNEEIPAHVHGVSTSSIAGDRGVPTAGFISTSAHGDGSFAPSADGAMNQAMVEPTTAPSEGHENCQPFLVLNWIIACNGVYPVRREGITMGNIGHAN